MIESRRFAMPRIRSIRLAVATAAALAGSTVLAGPALATPQVLTVEDNQHLNADGTVDVIGTYRCSGGPSNILLGDSVLDQQSDNVGSPSTTIPGTCDGAAHPYTIHFPAGSYFSFQPGPATFTSIWSFYDAAGNPTAAELVNAPITLRR
ncbi:hypothetical protein F3087_37250 [Nocardia colli]|uniref:DUF6299 domain-containing protein n=1 Tax=Nocardia colli TaxID=2545717 RepID=A0A5N0E660_9NOCA|nr:DUF6299 family protein [Nocardia colli]KAA8883899.1 hypothetical protein F3087_37250 [Nocardia colli]